MEEIIDDVTSKYGIGSSNISHSTIRNRATRSNNVIVSRMQGSYISPIVKVEDKLVDLIIQMTRIRHPLISSSYLQLVNDFISGTQVEKVSLTLERNLVFINDKVGKQLLSYDYWNRFKNGILVISLVSVIKNTKGIVRNGQRIVIFQTCMTI